jgi:penicillin-binding protein 1A
MAETRSYRKWLKWFWLVLLCPVLAISLMLLLANLGVFGYMPEVSELTNPKNNLATEIISSDGEVIGKFFTENRTNVSYDQISPYMVQALIATEDERYLKHSGIDFRALARAVAKMGKAGGGSTITQQLAKQLFTDHVAQNIVQRGAQKFKEWIIAVRLERLYTKEEIIAMYLNRYDFLNLAIGVESAAMIYFGEEPDSLDVLQSAMLVGMLKNSSYYNPLRRPELVQERRNTVLYQMVRNDFLEQEMADSLAEIPIKIDYHRAGHNAGLATYFREYLRGFMKEWLKNNPKPDGTQYNLYTDGLRIYTTIDSRMQRYAEEAVQKHLSNLQDIFFDHWEGRSSAPFSDISSSEINTLMEQGMKRSDRYRRYRKRNMPMDSIRYFFDQPTQMSIFNWDGEIDTVMSPMDSIRYHKSILQTGMMSMDPKTGFVKAWVGGNDYRYFQYDHVKQARRQVGSTFKPFVYATAIDQMHYSPCYEVPNVQVRFEKEEWGLLQDWMPKNSDGEYGGELSLKEGLATSTNTITAWLMKQVRPKAVIGMARHLGVEGEIPDQPAICLGTPDLSVYEMVGAYGTFANEGIYTEPITVLRIEDKNGVVLDEFMPETREVMSAEIAYVICDLLKGVTRFGTGVRLRTNWADAYKYLGDPVTGYPYAFTQPIAGKTGTTQNHSDGWFMGVVPDLVTGVWVGCEDRSAHFRSLALGQGATTALPIWAMYMRMCNNDPELKLSQEDFEKPEGEMTIEVDCDKFRQENINDPMNFDDEIF